MQTNPLFFSKSIQHKMGLITETILAATILIFFTSSWGLNYVFTVSFGLALAPLGLCELYNTIASIMNISKKPAQNQTHNFYHSLFGIIASGSAVFPITLTIALQFSKWNPFLFSVATAALALKSIEHVIFNSLASPASFKSLFIRNALCKVIGFLTLCLALYKLSPGFFVTPLTNPVFSMFALSGIAYAIDTIYRVRFEKSPAIEMVNNTLAEQP